MKKITALLLSLVLLAAALGQPTPAASGSLTVNSATGAITAPVSAALFKSANDIGSASASVTSITGTTNQITASASTGAVTLSLAGPHNFTSLTSTAVLLGGGTSAINASNLLYVTPTLTVPSGFILAGTDTITLTAGGSSAVAVPGSGGLSIGTNSVTALIVLNGAAASNRDLRWQTAGVNRWLFRVNSNAESGTAAGSNWVLNARDNTGANLGDVFQVTRATGKISIQPASGSVAAWGTTGAAFALDYSVNTATITDSSSSGTVASAVAASFGAPTFTSTSVTVFTDAFNVYMAGPVARSGNLTITRSHTLGIVDSTSASSSITGGFIVATTLGTAATSVGIGGGKINAGDSITAGGQVLSTYAGNSQAVFYASGSGQASFLAGFRQSNAANTDFFDIAQSGSAYAGALGSVGNNQSFIYAPNKLIIARGTGATAAFTFDGATLAVLATTASTSTTTGSFTTAGGLGVAGAGYFGGLIQVTGNIRSGVDGTQHGKLIVYGATSSQEGNIYSDATYSLHLDTNSNGRPIRIDGSALSISPIMTSVNATDATTISTGSIITAGGVGITKALWVGGLANIAGALTCQSTITTLGGATFHTTSTALTDGAGASVGTLTNAPSVGNPTKWIQINDNGTTRKIPTW